MVLVGHIEDLSPISFGFQQVSMGKLIEFFADRVAGDAKLFCKFPKVGSRLRIKEKPDKQFNSGFRGYEP